MTPTSALKLAVKVLEVINFGLDVADKCVDVLKNAGVIKNSKNSDELGAKVMRGAEMGLTPHNAKTLEDYKEYAKQIDEIKLTGNENYSPDKKREAADEFITGALNMHYGQVGGVNDFLKEVNKNPEYYSSARIEAYMNKAAQKNFNMKNIGRYLDSKLDSMQGIRQTESILLEAEKSLNVNENDAKAKFDAERAKRLK